MSKANHLITERDNKTFDPIRILAILGVAEYLVMSGYVVYSTKTFDLQNFGIGLSAVLLAAGAAVTAKATTEPKPQEL